MQILVTAETSKQPEEFKGVYAELDRIIASADTDPRKFTGFAKHWHPQKARLQRLDGHALTPSGLRMLLSTDLLSTCCQRGHAVHQCSASVS